MPMVHPFPFPLTKGTRVCSRFTRHSTSGSIRSPNPNICTSLYVSSCRRPSLSSRLVGKSPASFPARLAQGELRIFQTLVVRCPPLGRGGSRLKAYQRLLCAEQAMSHAESGCNLGLPELRRVPLRNQLPSLVLARSPSGLSHSGCRVYLFLYTPRPRQARLRWP